jgi:hypothetical protein
MEHGKMNGSMLLVLTVLMIVNGCSQMDSQPKNPPSINPVLQSELVSWLQVQGKSPERYVVDLFSKHEVVFLGEQHRVKHDVLLIQSLIKPLYQAGVFVLATEFGRREDQSLIDSLLMAEKWDEQLAREIIFRQYVFWGYQEYVDVFRIAWMLNKELADGAPRFKVLGINDSPDWSFIRNEADRDNPAIMRKVWGGASEEDWAKVILDAVTSGEKVLVHCGVHHAFTEYRQPIVIDGNFSHFDNSLRCGNHVFATLGKKAVTVFLHAPWNGEEGYGSAMSHPADGVIDAFMLEKGPHPAGFSLANNPFGKIIVQNAVYRHGYNNFKLSDFCDGWIYTKPISEYQGVTPISNWVNEGNIELARTQSPNPKFRDASVQEFNRIIAKDAEIHRRWDHLR